MSARRSSSRISATKVVVKNITPDKDKDKRAVVEDDTSETSQLPPRSGARPKRTAAAVTESRESARKKAKSESSSGHVSLAGQMIADGWNRVYDTSIAKNTDRLRDLAVD
eukprot:gene14947-10690_t